VAHGGGNHVTLPHGVAGAPSAVAAGLLAPVGPNGGGSLPGGNRKIAFSRNPGPGGNQIFAMNRDDTELEQLGLTAPDDHELA
jgi:hypothetical protein